MSQPSDNLPPLTARDDELPDDEHGPFAPGQKVGTYEVVDEIGRGGMCIVYKATDSSLKRTVALKVLRPSLARRPKIARRFHHESVLSANLSHEGIAPIYSMEYHPPNLPYFAMELVEGETIDSRVRTDGPFAPDQAVAIARQAAATLSYAHSRDVIHRDITPRNVLVNRATGRVRVVDFGIAQDTTGEIHETYVTQDSSLGTIAFMSPEQNLSGKVDRRSDVFSLGMTLYFMLAGRPAYTARNRAELALAFQMGSPSAPSEHNPAVPPDLDRVVLRMIAVDPDQRHANCAEASEALQAAMAERPDDASKSVGRAATPVRVAVAIVLLASAILVGAWKAGPLLVAMLPSPPATRPPSESAGPVSPSESSPAASRAEEANGFSLFGPIPAPPASEPADASADPVAFAARTVKDIEIPVPPADWTAPDAPADGSKTWLEEFAPVDSPQPDAAGSGN
ncbi:MAG: protein kinase domain-containing protein [Phycisphaerae bacterium]